MKHSFDIPARMQHLLLDERGYPIPYFVPIVDGKPEFRYQDGKKRDTCIKYKKCAVCGGRFITNNYWLIAGPLGLMNKISSDYPMHEECARFSIQVCPHLIFHKAERRSDQCDDPNVLRDKPESIFLVRADKIWTIEDQGNVYIKYRPFSIEKYIYKENKLIAA